MSSEQQKPFLFQNDQSRPGTRSKLSARWLKFALGLLLIFLGVAGIILLVLTISSNFSDRNLTSPTRGESMVPLDWDVKYDFAEPSTKQCVSDVCQQYMTTARSVMNELADPCDDFYEYACGNFGVIFEKPSNYVMLRRHNVVSGEIEKLLRESLQSQNFPKDPVFKKLRRIYSTCKLGLKNGQERSTIISMASSMGGIHVTVGSSYDIGRESLADSVAKLSTFNADALFRFRLGHIDKTLYETRVEGQSAHNRTVSQRILQVLFLQAGSHSHINGRLPAIGIQYGDSSATKYSSEILEMARWLWTSNEEFVVDHDALWRLFHFERKLATVSRSVEPDSSSVEFSSFSDLAAMCPVLPWLKIRENLNKALHLPDDGGLEAVVMDSGDRLFLREICKFWERETARPEGRRAAQNYVVVSALRPYFQRAININETNCLRDLSEMLPLAVGTMLEKSSLDLRTRQKVQAMGAELRRSFKFELGNSFALSESAKQHLTTLAQRVEIEIGYPEWKYFPEGYSHYLEPFNVSTSSHITNLVESFRFKFRNQVAATKRDSLAELGVESPLNPNARYQTLTNVISVYPSLIRPPYFHADYPDVINFASLGLLMAHELAHIFDNLAIVKAAKANDEDFAFLNARKQCTKAHFGNLTYFSEVTLDLSRTVNDDMAEIGGLQLAFKMYQEHKAKRGLANYYPEFDLTSDQMFFVAYAQPHCMSYGPGGLHRFVSSSSHTPDPYRVRGTLANSPEFARIFNCPAGYPMNPPQKCSMW